MMKTRPADELAQLYTPSPPIPRGAGVFHAFLPPQMASREHLHSLSNVTDGEQFPVSLNDGGCADHGRHSAECEEGRALDGPPAQTPENTVLPGVVAHGQIQYPRLSVMVGDATSEVGSRLNAGCRLAMFSRRYRRQKDLGSRITRRGSTVEP